jgi:hypothetical protein
VVSQQRADNLPDDDLVIRRLHPDGTVDTTFGGDGLAISPFKPGGVAADTVEATVAGDDIVVVGHRDGDAIATSVNT